MGIFFLGTPALAQDPQISALEKTVLDLREYAASHPDVRGGLPELTIAKHQLRDWVEFRLSSFPEKGDATALSRDLLSAFEAAKLFCDSSSRIRNSSTDFFKA